MVESEIPLYFNWSFWAVVVAAIAVFLSQIPPIKELIKSAKLDFEVYSKISITHKLGNQIYNYTLFSQILAAEIFASKILQFLFQEMELLFQHYLHKIIYKIKMTKAHFYLLLFL